MALDTPKTATQISQQAKVDVRRQIKSSDPFLARSYLGAIISGVCNRVFEFYDALRESELEANPATASRNLLEWASAYGFSQLPGSSPSGQLFVNASSGGTSVIIPNNTRYVSNAGSSYIQTGDATIGALSFAITSGNLTRVGTLITVTTSADHGLASNAVLTLTGGTVGYAIVDSDITVIAANKFTYVAASAPNANTAVATAFFTGAVVNVNAEDAGASFNLVGDTALAFETPIATVESPALATFPGVKDGSDLETTAQLQTRLIDHLQNPNTPFNTAEIRKQLFSIAGITRVFVQEQTPIVGAVTVYFMRDNDALPLPDAAEVAAALAKLIAIKPAHTSDSDIHVAAPAAVATNFTFTASALVPDTPTMRVAISEQLSLFFANNTSVGVNVPADAYRSAIFNTVDPNTGSRVTGFTLATPSSTITVGAGAIATLGVVSFA
jgi:uncharacterized phage protein gp47/JayE